jgi:putative ABC transport system substrate-binding protein
MRRREFITLIGGAAAAWPLVARAQLPAKTYRIFWVSTESQPDPFLNGFREGLRERGYVEGKNIVLELRYAPGNPDALHAVISELKRGNVDLAVSSGPATRAMRAATDVPVLFAISGDPVELGLVKSLAHPEGNFTGSSFLSLDLAAKRVDLLKEIFPQLRTLAVLSNTDHPGERSEWRTTQQAAQALGIDPVYVPFVGARELDNALVMAGNARADAILVFPEGATMVHRTRIAQFAIAQLLPSMLGGANIAMRADS